MIRKKHSLLQLFSLIFVLLFFSLMDSGAQVSNKATVIDKSKIIDSKQTDIKQTEAADLKKGTEAVKVAAPVITTHPVNATAIHYDNELAVFTVVATGSNLTYQWQRLSENSTSWYNITDSSPSAGSAGYSGTSTNKLTVSVRTNIIMNNSQFRCVVTNGG